MCVGCREKSLNPAAGLWAGLGWAGLEREAGRGKAKHVVRTVLSLLALTAAQACS